MSLDASGSISSTLPSRTTPHRPFTLQGTPSRAFALALWSDDDSLRIPSSVLPSIMVSYKSASHTITPRSLSPSVTLVNCTSLKYAQLASSSVEFSDGAPCGASLHTDHTSSVELRGATEGYLAPIEIVAEVGPRNVVFEPDSTRVNITSKILTVCAKLYTQIIIYIVSHQYMYATHINAHQYTLLRRTSAHIL